MLFVKGLCTDVLDFFSFCDRMVFCMWKRGTDPDNASIPYLTALGDLLGGALLAFTFELLFLIGDRDLDVGD